MYIAAMDAPAPDVFRAISDPTRRALLEMLAGQEQAVSALADRFAITQPAISQHLRVLREAGLVRERRRGRRRLYRLHPEPLREIHDWLAQYERFWRGRLVELGEHLRRAEALDQKRKTRTPRH